MNSCPLCHRFYEDETMKFCLDDGTVLLPATVVTDSDVTLVLPTPPPSGGQGHTVGILKTPTFVERPMTTQVDHAFASPRSRTAEAPRKSPLPWILGIVLVLGISALGVAFIVTRSLVRQSQQVDQMFPVTSSPSPAEITTAESPSTAPATTSKTPLREVASSSPGRPQTNKSDWSTNPTVKATPETTPEASSWRETPATPRAPISGGVLNGKAVRLVQPPYPPIARAAHASGTVTVQVVIDEDGNVISARAVSGHPLLQAAAAAAARASKFSPTKLSGQPVKVTGVIQYNFIAQ